MWHSFPGGSAGKESACNAEDLGSISGLGRPPGGELGNLLQYSCLENPHGQRSLAGYSPWGHTEWDMTERLSTHTVTILPSILSCTSCLLFGMTLLMTKACPLHFPFLRVCWWQYLCFC